MNRGKLVILLMLLAGCLMGGIAVTFHHWLSRRAIAWWGPENVEMIRSAPRLEALKLATAATTDSADVVTIGGVRYEIVERRDVSRAPGIDHVRHGLLEDAHFNWDQAAAVHPPATWQFGMKFVADGRQFIVAFDHDGHIGRSDKDEIVSITPIATGWSEFFAEQFGSSPAK